LDGRPALSQDRYLHETTGTLKKAQETFIPRTGLEHTIPVFKQARTFHAVDRTTTSMSPILYQGCSNISLWNSTQISRASRLDCGHVILARSYKAVARLKPLIPAFTSQSQSSMYLKIRHYSPIYVAACK
jgi:hypothetical protein